TEHSERPSIGKVIEACRNGKFVTALHTAWRLKGGPHTRDSLGRSLGSLEGERGSISWLVRKACIETVREAKSSENLRIERSAKRRIEENQVPPASSDAVSRPRLETLKELLGGEPGETLSGVGELKAWWAKVIRIHLLGAVYLAEQAVPASVISEEELHVLGREHGLELTVCALLLARDIAEEMLAEADQRSSQASILHSQSVTGLAITREHGEERGALASLTLALKKGRPARRELYRLPSMAYVYTDQDFVGAMDNAKTYCATQLGLWPEGFDVGWTLSLSPPPTGSSEFAEFLQGCMGAAFAIGLAKLFADHFARR
ncbi:MAG: hypothetical protein ACREQ9_20900, partial [Candidatus Binatia bacterium]